MTSGISLQLVSQSVYSMHCAIYRKLATFNIEGASQRLVNHKCVCLYLKSPPQVCGYLTCNHSSMTLHPIMYDLCIL